MDIIELDKYKSLSSLDFEDLIIYRPTPRAWPEKRTFSQHLLFGIFLPWIKTNPPLIKLF